MTANIIATYIVSNPNRFKVHTNSLRVQKARCSIYSLNAPRGTAEGQVRGVEGKNAERKMLFA